MQEQSILDTSLERIRYGPITRIGFDAPFQAHTHSVQNFIRLDVGFLTNAGYPISIFTNEVLDKIAQENNLTNHHLFTMTDKNQNNLFLAQHDAMSDIFVAPLGRIAGLRSMMSGISATTMRYSLDKDHDRQKCLDEIKTALSSIFMGTGVELFVEGIYEHGVDGSYDYQLSLTSVGTVECSKELVAFVRYSDCGKSAPGNIRFAAFNGKHIEFSKAMMAKYAPVKEYSITHLDVIITDLVKSEQKVPPAEAKLYESFYPFIEDGAGNLIEEFYDSHSNVLILTGIQGSGKSSLFRCMLNYNTEGKFFVIDNPAIYKNADQLSKLLGFLREEAVGSQVTVALEEIDAFVKEKDLDNMFLPRLLSISAGIVSSNIKFVLMANVPTIGQYAESLTRDGRTFKAINFRELTPEEAAVARADFGLEPMPFDEKHALSTVLNSKVRKPKRIRTSIGF